MTEVRGVKKSISDGGCGEVVSCEVEMVAKDKRGNRRIKDRTH
jgi:hypothetical protein